jgi:hypothetical protein
MQPSEDAHRRITAHRGRVRATFEHIPVAHYDVTPEALAQLEADPNVVAITPNLPVQVYLDHAMYSTDYMPMANYYIGSNVIWGSNAIWGSSSSQSAPGPKLVNIAINGENE